jgi:tetratricopeptide (TPR) repeat protein
MNLGATHANLGRLITANEYLRRSTSGFEALRDRSRAAESQLNRGALLIQYGGDAEEGMRLVQDALEVFRQLENRNFEVVAAHVFSTHYLHSGRYKDAERELNRALNLASERDLDTRSITTSIRLAQTRLATGNYAAARTLLTEALPRAPMQGRLEAMIYLARTNVRLGAFEMARTVLADVQLTLTGDRDRRLLPLLHLALGELAYESGQFREARRHFSEGAAYLIDEMPNEDALRARAFAGLLEALDGQTDSGRAKVAGTLDVAQRVGYRSMAAQCRVLLAQIEIARQQFREAQQALVAVPPDDESQAIDRELRAEIFHWSAKAWAGMGDTVRASAENAAARERVSSLAQELGEQYRPQFFARPLIAQILK